MRKRERVRKKEEREKERVREREKERPPSKLIEKTKDINCDQLQLPSLAIKVKSKVFAQVYLFGFFELL